MTANIARKHHYVPAALLGRWADVRDSSTRSRDRVLRVLLKGAQAEKVISPEDMCFQRDLYLLPEFPEDAVGRGLTYWTLAAGCGIELARCGDGESLEAWLERLALDPSVEKQFPLDFAERLLGREAEGPFLDLIGRLQMGHLPDEREQMTLRRFLALQLVRHPTYFEFSLPSARARTMAVALAQTALSGEYADDVLQNHVVLRQRAIMDAVFYPMAIASSVRRLTVEWPGIETQLILVAAPAGHPFVLGDSPAYPFLVDRRGRPLLDAPWPGFSTERALIALPLSPTSCLLLCKATGPERFARATAKPSLVAIVNTASVMTAMRFVVQPPEGTPPYVAGFDPRRSPPWRRAFLQ